MTSTRWTVLPRRWSGPKTAAEQLSRWVGRTSSLRFVSRVMCNREPRDARPAKPPHPRPGTRVEGTSARPCPDTGRRLGGLTRAEHPGHRAGAAPAHAYQRRPLLHRPQARQGPRRADHGRRRCRPQRPPQAPERGPAEAGDPLAGRRPRVHLNHRNVRGRRQPHLPLLQAPPGAPACRA